VILQDRFFVGQVICYQTGLIFPYCVNGISELISDRSSVELFLR